MDYFAFKQRFEQARIADPFCKDFYKELGLRETPSTTADIEQVERDLKAKLPTDYLLFLKDYGGGLVGGFDIYSAKVESNLYIARHQWVPGFVAITGDGCGNNYGFKVENGQCQSNIVFWEHEENRFESTEWNSVLDFLLFAAGAGTD
jgi:cell wall assembly regulator SMI1